MKRPPIDFRRSRWARAVVIATLATFVSATNAFACLDTCVSTFGSVFQKDANTYWELASCTQRFNSGGGVTTVCYYHVYEV